MKLSRIYILSGIIAVSVAVLLNSELGGNDSGAHRIAVITRCYGVTAEEIEETITVPFEQAFSTVAGIEELIAFSEFSLSRIDMKLYPSADINEITAGIRNRTDRVFGIISEKNQSVQKPQIVTSGSTQQAVFSAAISHRQLPLTGLRFAAENNIKTEYSGVAGLGEIDIAGGAVNEVHIFINTDKAAAYGFSYSEAASLIRRSNIFTPCGSISDGILKIPVSFDAGIDRIEDLRDIPLTSDVKLSDIAVINYAFREQDTINNCNGAECIGLYIKSSSSELIRISRELRKITDKIKKTGFNVEIVNDRGAELENLFYRITAAVCTGIVISTMILSFFGMDPKRLVYLGVSQPLIIITAAGITSAIGFSPDSFILTGFAIGTGMIIDYSIIITNALKTGIESYKKMMKPLVLSTISTLIALLPVFSLKSEIPDCISIISALAAVLTVSLLLSSVFLPELYIPDKTGVKRIPQHLITLRLSILRTINRFINIKRASVIWAMLFAAGIICLLNLPLQIKTPLDTEVLFLHIEFDTGESIQSVNKKILAFSKTISVVAGIENIQSASRRGGGTMIINYNPKKINSKKLAAILKKESKTIKGGSVYFPENSSSDNTEIRISVTGNDTVRLKEISKTALQILLQKPWATEGILHFKADSPAYNFITDAEALYAAGVSAADAAAFLRWNIQGPVADKWQQNGTEQDLRIMAVNRNSITSSDIAALKMPLPEGLKPIRLDQLGKIVRAEESLRINRLNMQHAESFTVVCIKTDPVKLHNLIWDELDRMDLPQGYSFIPSTKLIQKKLLYKRLWLQFFTAVILIFLLLCIERESITQPLIIMMQLPPVLAVPVIILKITGAELGTETIIGLILLSGMSINNGIIIINNIDKGIMPAIKMRFNDLFLTTITSFTGMIPLLFTSNTFFIVTAVILMSGIAASFINSLFLFPSFLFYYKSG